MDEPMKGGMAPDTGATSPDQSPPQQPGEVDQTQPDMQGQYNRFVGRAMELIYNEATFPTIVKMLRGSGQAGGKDAKKGTAQGLVQATVMVISRIAQLAKQAGQELSPDVIFHGGTEIFSQIAEISDKAGLSDYANDRDALEAAYFKAIDTYLEQAAKAGDIDQQAAQAQMQKLQAMDQNGQLDQMLRDLDAKDQQARQPANDNEPPAQEDAPDEDLKGGMAQKGMV